MANMTISSHNRHMKQVRIADLKARLSEHLRAVRAGESIAVLDRDTPVAQLIPVSASRALRVRKPALGSPPLHRIKVPKRTRLNVDIVRLLLEERQGHR
ncbi:MAG: type II toxin-antitoxin system prevent-host-death family antitoxin [Acidobacteria bacterium]|nr:type II toxin-antitoxin system prevent-host-death family antitoxin [Acidobacteriota bacterium]